MQITETVNQDLRREYKVVIPANDLDKRLTGKIEELKPRMNLKGFRPGKAPLSHLKKTFGKQMMSEIVEAAVTESSQQAVKDNNLKPAFPPRVDLSSELAEVVDGKSDLEFTVKVDLMPEFELADVSKLKVEKLVSEVTDTEVDEAMMKLAEQTRTYTDRDAGEAAQDKDQVVIDFVGRVDGEEFTGGKAEDFSLTLGSGQFIPGFEDQLVGAKGGEARDVNVAFPAAYPEAKLVGQEAVFKVTVTTVKKPDALDAEHAFSLPPTMVEGEFDAIWKAVQAELEREGKTAADEGKTEDELKKEYHDIAERRVRLGLVLAKLGEQNGITIAPDEINRAVAMRARQFPGQEQQVFQFYSSNPQAMAEIRAPIFEDKVVDFIAELAQVTEKKVDRETLFMDPDEAVEKMKEADAPAEKSEKKAKKAKKSEE